MPNLTGKKDQPHTQTYANARNVMDEHFPGKGDRPLGFSKAHSFNSILDGQIAKQLGNGKPVSDTTTTNSGSSIPDQKPMAASKPTGSVRRVKKKTIDSSRAGLTIGLNAKPSSQTVGTGINTNQ
jgi:hypothetical protein